MRRSSSPEPEQAHHVEGRGHDDLRLRVGACVVMGRPLGAAVCPSSSWSADAGAPSGTASRSASYGDAARPRRPGCRPVSRGASPGRGRRARAACTWKTVWPPSAPVLSTSAEALAEALEPRRRRPPRRAARPASAGSAAASAATSTWCAFGMTTTCAGACGGDVAEGQHVVGLVHHGRGDLARDDAAEQAVAHAVDASRPARSVRGRQRFQSALAAARTLPSWHELDLCGHLRPRPPRRRRRAAGPWRAAGAGRR